MRQDTAARHPSDATTSDLTSTGLLSSSTPLKITLISLHGLIRAHDPELGRDADTGGQVKYVLELARELAARQDVREVELLTRQIIDPQSSRRLRPARRADLRTMPRSCEFPSVPNGT